MLLRPFRVILALVLCVFLAACSAATGGADTPSRTPSKAAATTAPHGSPAPATAPTRTSAPAAAPTGTTGLDAVRLADLPPEARKTLALIATDGPYPYAKDGTVFSNFEKVLPRKPRGYYHEYTVKTPGSRDRGARRIVTGQSGEIFWTDDHYKTFREVVGNGR
ncbi:MULTISPECIES: ribonuclease domain-containing protein [unclassified Streptomyces]|uniref:ribonuclease domain-containing protein n=1 Tax=unclassified Streptomyces TaxID=2593676 RepID=UPI001660FACE|nr:MULTISPECIES: ribonuclease domain-containing protein [unclassified Streptomyces]MBD0711416.1 guanine-specific ribonuclease N1 and T1 [Streptomyces sp. CBMA291]MBD0717076.1 guanine-specific ribonuclease N1 and T1 [Streptomyces sp. CBMA370]